MDRYVTAYSQQDRPEQTVHVYVCACVMTTGL